MLNFSPSVYIQTKKPTVDLNDLSINMNMYIYIDVKLDMCLYHQVLLITSLNNINIYLYIIINFFISYIIF